jgi:hypothetical protein
LYHLSRKSGRQLEAKLKKHIFKSNILPNASFDLPIQQEISCQQASAVDRIAYAVKIKDRKREENKKQNILIQTGLPVFFFIKGFAKQRLPDAGI